MNNCIGHFNRAHFARFLVSVTFGTLYSLGLLALRLCILIKHDNYRFSLNPSVDTMFMGLSYDLTLAYTPTEMILFCIVVIVLLILLMTVGTLTGYQLYYICKGQTTIETFEMDRIEQLVDKEFISIQKGTFPFNHGMYQNLKETFGEKWIFWMIPKSQRGNGIDFEVNVHYESSMMVAWPPKEYYRYQCQLTCNQRYKNDPNWKGDLELDSDSGSDSSIGYDSDEYSVESPVLSGKEFQFTPGSFLAKNDIRHGNEGVEVRIASMRNHKDKKI